MAAAPERFSDKVLAELRGVVDDQGTSAFWECLGRHFFRMDFADADKLSATTDNQFIVDLMPRYPIYVDLLPPEAREVIGRCHSDGVGAYKLLQWEGFEFDRTVDIFDGGPTMTARTDQIRSIREAKDSIITEIRNDVGDHISGEKKLITLGRLHDFKAGYGWIDDKGDDVIIDGKCARALGLSVGDAVTYIERT
jgi:arginine N-succinyltransferase